MILGCVWKWGIPVYPKKAILLVEKDDISVNLEKISSLEAIEVAISSVLRSRLEGPLQWLAIRINN
jgi:hypothetical protein